jgi:hypothetical protein
MTNSEQRGGNDPLQEPENSTVDDWMGQRVDRDTERAERLLEETGGDEQEAARRFDAESEAEEWHEQHVQDD